MIKRGKFIKKHKKRSKTLSVKKKKAIKRIQINYQRNIKDAGFAQIQGLASQFFIYLSYGKESAS